MKKSHFFALIGGLVLMFGGPAVGMFLAVLRMSRAVRLAQADPGAAPHELAAELAGALAATQVGLALGTLGLVVLLAAIALHFLARRARLRSASPLGPARILQQPLLRNPKSTKSQNHKITSPKSQ